MNSVKLYKPKNINVEVPFPENWDELLPTELELIASLIQSGIADETQRRTIVFNGILQARGRRHKLKVPANILDMLDPEQVVLEIYPMIDWLFNSNTLTRQPYPTIPLPGLRSTTVYGPKDGFDDVTCGEYEDAEVHFFEFNETGELAALARLASILFRPKNVPYLKIIDHKTVYYPLEKRFSNFMRLPKEKLLAIWLWFTGCRNMMTLFFPYVFGGDGGGKPGKADKLSFTKCIHAGAGPKNGSRQQVRVMPIKEFFFDMNEEAKAVAEMKTRSNK